MTLRFEKWAKKFIIKLFLSALQGKQQVSEGISVADSQRVKKFWFYSNPTYVII